MVRSRLPGRIAACLMIMIPMTWASWHGLGRWQVREGLARARRQIEGGQYGPARDRLLRLDTIWPHNDEVVYLLGLCESELGRPREAVLAWEKVSANSSLNPLRAIQEGRALVHELGRLGDAERLYRDAANRGSGPKAIEARWTLAELLLWEGRLDEFRRLLGEIGRVGTVRDRIAALRELWRLDTTVVAAEEVEPILERAEQNAPEDNRVKLVRARVATCYGRFDEARDDLDKCPESAFAPGVLARVRLQWAIAAGEPEEAKRALQGIPIDQVAASEPATLRAWFAARRNDATAERLALEQVIAIEPGNTTAIDRLASLARQAGDSQSAAALRRRQEDALLDKNRYRRLMIENHDPIPQEELHERARLAERLGRWYESEGWLRLALEREPSDRSAREALDRVVRQAPKTINDSRPGASLLDLVREPEILAEPTAPSKGQPVRTLSAGKLLSSSVLFRDDAAKVGLTFTYRNGETPYHPIPETIGGGVAILDYDGDGWLDVYLVQGGTFPPRSDSSGTREETGDRLFRNRRDGSFEDATKAAGLDRIGRGYGFGVASGDYDNDGRPDLFVSRFGSYVLLRNRGDGTFEDATERAGLGGARDWPTSAAFADLDGDGDLDLYVCHYLTWDAEHPTLCPNPEVPERYGSCLPLGFPALPDHLFRNEGGRFVDVTESAGIVDRDGRGLGVVVTDLDDDGRIDLFVANDMTANLMFHNLGGLKFEEVGHSAGVACNAEGGYQAGMGIACGDLDRDGRPDLAVTNFFGESTTYYHNLGQGMFADETSAVGLKAPSRFLLGFGITFLDVDNDGCLDLATANGHIHDLRPKIPYAMPAQLLMGDAKGRLREASAVAGEPWSVPRIGRGLARADLDNDGRIDLLLVAQNSPIAYLHNQTRSGGHFLTVRLEGTRSNRDAIGTRVTVKAGGVSQTRWRIGGGSYASSEDPRLHFGLGSADRIESVEVRWPSGHVDHFRDLPVDTGYLLRESDAKPRPLTGRPPSATGVSRNE